MSMNVHLTLLSAQITKYATIFRAAQRVFVLIIDTEAAAAYVSAISFCIPFH